MVVATAPIPTVRTPNFPFGFAIAISFFATLLVLRLSGWKLIHQTKLAMFR
jgi:hypothetical protein